MVNFSIAKIIDHGVDYPIQSSVVHQLTVYPITLATVSNAIETYYLARNRFTNEKSWNTSIMSAYRINHILEPINLLHDCQLQLCLCLGHQKRWSSSSILCQQEVHNCSWQWSHLWTLFHLFEVFICKACGEMCTTPHW